MESDLLIGQKALLNPLAVGNIKDDSFGLDKKIDQVKGILPGIVCLSQISIRIEIV
jgi:hypothetical protein